MTDETPAAQPKIDAASTLARGATEGTLFDQLGGEPKLRAIVHDFVNAIFDDVMIGFFFRHASRERIEQKEYEFAANHLGAPVVYSGRPIAAVHAAHPIMGGQFMRRLQILKETLARHGAAPHIIEHFVAHTENLRSSVTRDELGQCIAPVLHAAASDADPSASGSSEGSQ